MKATLTLGAINAALEADNEKEHRTHLGASLIGQKCQRKIWYQFHWVLLEYHSGKQLRLFKRGQDWENVFNIYLKGAGIETFPVDPATGKQWRILDCNGHFGGSCDGLIRGIPEMPTETLTNEYKTHNDASFKALVRDGLCKAKGEHFDQCQIYTFKLGFKWCLYLATNKNDDHLHAELIQVNPTYCKTLLAKAARIIDSPEAPPKISATPDFYLCRPGFCKFSDICHNGAPPDKNCRTCKHSLPVEDGKWICTKFNNFPLDKEHQHKGCKAHEFRKSLLG